MKPLEALRAFFKPADVTVALPDSPFIVIDRQKAIETLKLEKRGEEAGAREQPPTDGTEPDAVEAEIFAEMSEHLNRAQIDADNNLRVYSQRLGELALLRELSTVTGASETALGDYDATIIAWRNRLANARDAIKDSYQELTDFKAEHGLRRPAHDVPPLLYTGSVIGASWVIESFANTAFLRVGDEYGLVGGFVAAAIIAAINVFVSAIVGRKIWPYLFHRDLWRRLAAWVASAAWAAGLITWNMLAAHFRDAKSLGLETPEVQALSLLASNTFVLSSIYSYGLLAMGLVFGIISAIAAFKMDDPYPGYGPIYRRHEERCDDYADEIEQALGELKAIRDSAIGILRATRDQLRMQFGERNQIIDARKALLARFEQHQDYLDTVGNSLLEHYRAANRQARSTPPPGHFRQKWKLHRAPLPPVPEEPSIEADVAAAQRALDHSIETISNAHNGAIRNFQALDEIKGSLEHGKA